MSFLEDVRIPYIGDQLPKLEVETTHGMKILPNDYEGRWFILFSHHFTHVCTTEFIAFETIRSEFSKRNTELIGISIDEVQSHIKWIEWFQQNLGVQITFPIIADGLGNVAKSLGMIHPTRGSRTVRSVFVVDPMGTVRLVLTYPETIGRNVHEILRALVALQTSDLYKAATPANWPNSEWLQDTLIIPTANNIQEANCQLAKMKSIIKDVEIVPIKMPLNKKYKGSNYFMTHRVTIITRVTTEDGIIGEIYNGDELEDLDKIVNMLKTEITPLVLGENIFEVNRIWKKIYPLTYNVLANRKIALNAISCIDSAIHDAIGKALDFSLVKMWGGTKTKLPVMVIGGYYTEGVEVDEKAIVSDIESYKEMGASACKFKVGGRTPEIDVKRVEIARKAAGDDFIIAVDANQGWSRSEALRFALGVKDFGIRWFEEPCRWSYDKDAMKDIRYMSGIPVTAGQSEYSPAKCIEFMTNGSIDVCNYDASWSGGPTVWRQVAGAAAALGLEMAHHEEPQISAHLLGSALTGTFLEVFHPDRDPLFYHIIENRNPFKDGYYQIPDGPGFGIQLNNNVIEKYRVD